MRKNKTIGFLKFVAVCALLGVGTDVWGQPASKPVVIALNHEPSTLDLTSTRDSPSVRPTMENVVESLWGIDPNGDMVPTLATWQISADGKVIVFNLRRGVKFHSGDEMTAKDVVFSHERSLQKAPQYLRRARLLEKIEAVDDYTVRFDFKQVDTGFLPGRQLFVVSRAYFDRVGETAFVERPVGTGPYKFVEYKAGTSLDVEAFAGYWGEKPTVQKARFVFSKDDSTRVLALRAGEVDLIMNTPYSNVGEIRKSGFKTVNVAVHPTMSVQFPFANTKAPWADRRVRLAIAHAIDGDAIAKGLMHGIPERNARLAPGELGYDPEIKNYRYDPALAKKLLAEAGYANGLSLKLIYWSGTYQGSRETAEAVTLYLKAIGISADVQALDSVQMIDLVRKSRTDENVNYIAVAPMPMANFDPVEALSIAYHSASAFSLYKNAEFDKNYELAASEPDTGKRAEHIKSAIRIMHDDVATVPIWNTVAVYAMKDNLEFVPVKRTFPLVFLKNLKVN